MKKSPDTKKLEEMLGSSKLVAGGFRGRDKRPLSEIIDTDLADLAKLGYTVAQLADRMQQLTDIAKPRLGCTVTFENLEISVLDYPGKIVCPWPHPGRYVKRITTVRRQGTTDSIRWSDLNIHLIAVHGFFEGRGSAFRLEPRELIPVIFRTKKNI